MTSKVSVVRRVGYAIGAAVLLLVAIVAIRIAPLFLAPNAYKNVASIERRTDYRNAALMKNAWQLPVGRAYARSPLEYQANPSFCGPTSIANLLRSIGMPATQRSVIEGTRYDPWFGILIGGLTIDQLGDLLAYRLGRHVVMVRKTALPEFRQLMRLANDPRRRMLVNFHRGPMFGRGHGHFSPVLAYLPAKDLVLVGDVNADFKPYLTPTARLWAAVDTIDDTTDKKRGLLIVTL